MDRRVSRESARRKVLKIAALATLVIAPLECTACMAGNFLVSQQLLFAAPDPEGYDEYLAKRDDLLGWPTPESFGTGAYDASGARISPAFPDPTTTSCVATFGDSFTWGDEVEPEHAYPNVLSQTLGCRVANYGVGGYGTDQALLRFRDRIEDPAPVVVLGHYSENIIRNVNQFRGFMGGPGFGLKPRFVLEDDTLKLVPLAELTADEFTELGERGAELLPHDFFAPGGPTGIHTKRFPFLWSVPQAFGHYRVRAKLAGVPSYAPFYDADHPAGGLALTAAIIREFYTIATARGQKALVVLIPDEKDLLWRQEHGDLPYAPLAKRLEAAGIPLAPLTTVIDEALGDREPCALYTRCGGAHFNPEGYALVATAVHRGLVEHGFVTTPVPADG